MVINSIFNINLNCVYLVNANDNNLKKSHKMPLSSTK